MLTQVKESRMRLQLVLIGLLLAGRSSAQAEPLRVTDTLTLTSKAADLLGGKTKATTTIVSRVLAPPGAEGGAWTATYEQMTTDGVPIPGAQGRRYSVTLGDGALKVEPIAPTDEAGIAGVVQDLDSLRPIFAVAPLCERDDMGLCPALYSLLRRFGEPKLKKANGDGPLSLEVTTSQGEKLEGIARLEPEKWTIELDSVRRETIPYDVVGEGTKEKSAEISGHYVLVREFVKLP
jgi:hypothetical protein